MFIIPEFRHMLMLPEDEFFKAYERLEDNSYSKIDTDAILWQNEGGDEI